MAITSLYDPAARGAGRAAAIQAYYLKDWQGYDMALHSHNQTEIMYVISGRCAIRLRGSETHLKKGEFILLDAMVPHGLHVAEDAPCRIMNIEFTMDRAAASLPLDAACARHQKLRRFLAEPRPAVVLSDTEDVYGALRRIINCLDEGGEGQAYELELHVMELLLAIARLHDEGAEARGSGDAYVRRAIQFMHRNYFREIAIEDVSAHAGVAAGYLSRLFKKRTGRTMVGYLAELRIHKAKMLLGRTELPIAEISGYVGVPSREYFNQLFKKHTGMTPGQYRKACDREPGPVEKPPSVGSADTSLQEGGKQEL